MAMVNGQYSGMAPRSLAVLVVVTDAQLATALHLTSLHRLSAFVSAKDFRGNLTKVPGLALRGLDLLKHEPQLDNMTLEVSLTSSCS